MEKIDLRTWEEFEEHVEQLACRRAKRKGAADHYISEYLFRGQSNSSWGLTTTLERNSGRLLTLVEYYRIVRATKPQVETHTGATWEIPSSLDYTKQLEESDLLPPGKPLAYEYLIYLRHHGFPSPLLDWTLSPYVAAYFAFRDVCSIADSVSIYAYCEYIVGHKSGSSNKPKITGLGPNVRSHRRHFQQQSQYTFCTINRGSNLSYARHDEVFAGNNKDQDEFVVPRPSVNTWHFRVPSAFGLAAYS